MQGAFIVFEGLDGAGTTTQAQRLVASLNQQGKAAAFTCEPSSGPIGTLIRQALSKRLVQADGSRLNATSLALLFAADRVDHLSSEIRPLQNRGVHVLCDRYLLSSLAYQGQELDSGFVEQANQQAPAPDLTLYLRVSPETAQARRRTRHSEDELFEALETQRRVQGRYEEAVARLRDQHRIVVIDAEQSEEAVAQACREAVRETLGL